MVLPLLLLGAPIIADFIFQWWFEQEREKKQLELLEQGYASEDVVYTDVNSSEPLFQSYGWEDDPGAAFLAQALWG